MKINFLITSKLWQQQQQHECEDQNFGLKLTGFVQGQQRKSLRAIYLEIEHQKACPLCSKKT